MEEHLERNKVTIDNKRCNYESTKIVDNDQGENDVFAVVM